MDLFENHQRLLALAEKTDFTDETSVNAFTDEFDKFVEQSEDEDSKEYELFIFHLARNHDRRFYERTGYQLLRWLFENHHILFEEAVKSTSSIDKMFPIHTAISNQSVFFLDSLLEISTEQGISDILGTKDDNGRTCVFAAIGACLPHAKGFVEKCSWKTVLVADNAGWTPLHVAAKLQQKGSVPRLSVQRRAEPASDARMAPNTSKLRNSEQRVPFTQAKTHSFTLIKRQRTNEARNFDPHEIYNEMKNKAKTLPPRIRDKYMADLLTAITNSGMSTYQIRTKTFDISRGTLQHEAKKREARFQQEMKGDIFKYLGHDMSLVRKALYGTQGLEKELFIDMSDFSNPSHDYTGYIAELTADLEELEERLSVQEEQRDTEKSPAESKNENPLRRDYKRRGHGKRSGQDDTESCSDNQTIHFEDVLFYVCLPDFNNFKEPPHNELRRLFQWLKLKDVRTIKSLHLPDSTNHPMSEILVQGAIFNQFEVNKLQWRKLDINLEILTTSRYADQFTDITLYSSGNWSVLYHWVMSDEGIVLLTGLQKVTIVIVKLNPTNDEEAHQRHKVFSQKYKGKLDSQLQRIKEDLKLKRPNFTFKVVTDEKWHFPAASYDQKTEPFVPNLKLYEHLNHCHSFLKSLNHMDTEHLASGDQQLFKNIRKRFKSLTKEQKDSEAPDERIKVAVIDNGTDRIRSSISKKIAKGVSFVTAGAENDDRFLPWWTVSDPHGTQMASLIEKANPFCRLYIARVGKGRKDILPENAAKAVRWAIEQKVDVISISWITKQDNPALNAAIEEALKVPILVFCSTADEGIYSGPVFPAKYDGTVCVAATDRYGHLQPTSPSNVNILVPGEDVIADGPSYMSEYATGTVSGSSVATASAAGIASLILLLLKTFNLQAKEEQFKDFYTKDGIMRVFDKMQANSHWTGIQLDGLFPHQRQELEKTLLGRTLHRQWQLENFPKGKSRGQS